MHCGAGSAASTLAVGAAGRSVAGSCVGAGGCVDVGADTVGANTFATGAVVDVGLGATVGVIGAVLQAVKASTSTIAV